MVARPETALYLPVKQMLEAQGFEVKGEIKGCDLVAVKGDEQLVVELKNTLNLTLILQAVERLSLTDYVYVAVPADCAPMKKQQKSILKLLRRLGVGLIQVAFVGQQHFVETTVSPGEYQPRKNYKKRTMVLNEFARLKGDPNTGGASTKQKRMTVYRQRCLNLATFLCNQGPEKAAIIAKATDDEKARYLLAQNTYGWFERVSTGIYQLSELGKSEMNQWMSDEEG